MKRISEKNLIIIIIFFILVLAGVVGGITKSQRKPETGYVYANVTRGSLTNEVKAVGVVKAAQEINLAFDRSGRVKTATVEVGDKVEAGQILAKLDSTDLDADVSQSAASVARAKSQLETLEAILEMQQIKKTEMSKGAKPEELQLAKTKVENMESGLADAKANLENIGNKASIDYSALADKIFDLLQDAYTKAFDALNRQTNEMFKNPDTDDPSLIFETPLDTSYRFSVEYKRVAAKKAVQALEELSQKAQTDYTNYGQLAEDAVNQLEIVSDYLSTINTALNYTVTSIDFPASTYDIYRSNANSGLAGINSIVASLNNYSQSVLSLEAANDNLVEAAETKVNSAENSLKLAENELALLKSGATAEQLAAQDAIIAQAQANVNAQHAQIDSARASAYKAVGQADKTKIISPIEGVVVKFDLKIGESVLPGVPVVSVMTVAKLQVESYVTEDAIFDIEIGNLADVTLDPLGKSAVYKAKIINIDPAATMVNGSPTFKVTLEFVQDDAAIKPGLTANVRIFTYQENNTLIIPETSIIKDGNNSYVIVKNKDSNGEKRLVEIGSVIADGKVSIASGLDENDQIVDFGVTINK